MNEKLKSSPLSLELEQLFDIKNAKFRDEKRITQEAMEAQRDIRLLTMMFCDGVPDIKVPVNETEAIHWDSFAKKLLYIDSSGSHILEAASKQTMIRMRPHLALLVKQAKEFYRD